MRKITDSNIPLILTKARKIFCRNGVIVKYEYLEGKIMVNSYAKLLLGQSVRTAVSPADHNYAYIIELSYRSGLER